MGDSKSCFLNLNPESSMPLPFPGCMFSHSDAFLDNPLVHDRCPDWLRVDDFSLGAFGNGSHTSTALHL
jgi:hypothetical protein